MAEGMQGQSCSHHGGQEGERVRQSKQETVRSKEQEREGGKEERRDRQKGQEKAPDPQGVCSSS